MSVPSRPPGPPNVLPIARSRILIVEDDAAFRALLARKLSRHGSAVTVAASAEDALAVLAAAAVACSKLGFDVGVSDVGMRGMGGLHLLAILHTMDPTLPAVLISASSDASTSERAARLGVRALVRRPFDLDSFCALVAAVL